MGAYALVIMIVAEGKRRQPGCQKTSRRVCALCAQYLLGRIFRLPETSAESGQSSLGPRELVLDPPQKFLHPLFFVRQAFMTAFQVASFFLIHDSPPVQFRCPRGRHASFVPDPFASDRALNGPMNFRLSQEAVAQSTSASTADRAGSGPRLPRIVDGPWPGICKFMKHFSPMRRLSHQ